MSRKPLVAVALCLAATSLTPAQTPSDADVFGPGPFLDDARIRAGVIATAERVWAVSDQRFGMRVQRYDAMLPRGTVIRPALPDAVPSLVCQNACWLHFVDQAPGAHFAHPVTYVVTDARSGVQTTLETDWWPEISGPWVERQQAFAKLEQRLDPALTILEKPALYETSPAADGGESIDAAATFPDDAAVLSVLGDPCDAWAVIVCGYDDLPDTFDDDTNGIYAVLRDLGVPADQIYYLSPHTTHTGVDLTTTRDNVDWAIQQVASRADAGDKFLFFYSSHGNIDWLSCIGGGISGSRLDGWLDSITSEETTVIIEACHSGSLIGRYADGSYVQAEDDLTGDGETNRAVFTSASTDTSSWPDLDGADDPNPADSGSETIWGYIEAFSIPAADTDTNGAISFLEGWQYAWDNDVTRIRGMNTPQMTYTGLDPDRVYHLCFPTADHGGPYDAECQQGGMTVQLDGSASLGPDPCGPYTFDWATDCPGASFDDPAGVSPVLSVDTGGACVECEVSLTMTCDEGSYETRQTTLAVWDDTAPSMACPADVTVACDESTVPDDTGWATTDDACDPAVVVDYDDTVHPGACTQQFALARAWTAQDACGNAVDCAQTITVVDEIAPEAFCNAPATITPPDAPITFTAGVTDACDPAPTVEIVGYRCEFYAPNGRVVDKGDSCIVTVDGDSITIVDSGGVGDHIYWSLLTTDECGNTRESECHTEVVLPH